MTVIRVIDFETTGADPADGAEVCEVGYCDLVLEQRGIDNHASFLCGVKSMPPEVRAVHHISLEECEGKPLFNIGMAMATGLRPTKSLRRHKPLPVNEHQPWPSDLVKAALESDDGRVRLLTHLLYYSAQRLSDVLKMQWSDIMGDTIRVRQQKTGKVLAIPMHAALRIELDNASNRTANRGRAEWAHEGRFRARGVAELCNRPWAQDRAARSAEKRGQRSAGSWVQRS